MRLDPSPYDETRPAVKLGDNGLDEQSPLADIERVGCTLVKRPVPGAVGVETIMRCRLVFVDEAAEKILPSNLGDQRSRINGMSSLAGEAPSRGAVSWCCSAPRSFEGPGSGGFERAR